jgi:serine/threonine protein kinase
MSKPWESWQGHALNGVFPLQRYLGASDHSGVFLTQLPKRQSSAVAIKLVSAGRGDPALVDSQLARWKIASRIAHPHLLGLLEVGRCELEGMPCAYAVMEYADQTLAQLLLHRTLTENETREMLVPALDGLAFLHDRGFVHGGLKPPNILVVGEQLKLAGDTLRVSGSAAADIQGLGRTLVEALTRRAPPAVSEGSDDVVALPEDVSPGFRAIVARCLSRRPEDRPDVAELRDWIRGRSAQSLPTDAARRSPAEDARRSPAEDARQLSPEALVPEPRVPVSPPVSPAPRVEPPRPERRASLSVASAVAAVLVLGWLAAHQVRKSHSGAPTPAPAVPTLQASPPETAAAAVTQPRAPITAGTTAEPLSTPASPRTSAGTASASRVHEAIPAVPLSARETIQGHIKVWIRVSVDREGRVFAAHPDRPGPSRYFERLAIDAARKWTFPPVETPSSRLMQVRFEFSRSGTSGHAVTLP